MYIMPGNTPNNIATTLSDRDVLLHILQHVEALTEVLEEFRPLLAMVRGPDGKPDMISVAQTVRRFRRGRT